MFLLSKSRSFYNSHEEPTKKKLCQLFQFCLTVGRGHHDCLEPSGVTHPKDISSELKEKYGEDKVTEEICPNCSEKFQVILREVLKTKMACCSIVVTIVSCDNCQHDFDFAEEIEPC